MFNNIKKYFLEGPLQEYKAFKKAYKSKTYGLSNDIRHAIDCASSFYHFYEHLYLKVDILQSQYDSKNNYLKYILGEFPQFQVVRDITDCSKHHKLTRSDALIRNADQIKEFQILTQYEDEKGQYYVASKGITAKLENGIEIDLYKLLTVTRYFWLNELFELKILPTKPKVPKFITRIPKRQSEYWSSDSKY